MVEQATNPVATEVENTANLESVLQEAFGPKPSAPKAKVEPEPAPPAEEVKADPAEDQVSDELTADDVPDEEQSDGKAEQSAEDASFEIVHNGKQHKLSRAETIELAQKGFDYTQKTQAVAAREKQVQEALDLSQQAMQTQIELADDLAQIKAFQRALQPYQNVDWVGLATNEPLEYPKHRAQYDQLIQGHNAALRQYQQRADAVMAARAEAGNKILGQEAQKLGDLVPRWRDADKFKADAREIAAYGLKEGYADTEMNSIRDARMVRTLWKAMQYDRLVQAKGEKVKQMRNAPPVVKPGAPVSNAEKERGDMRSLQQGLRKAGRANDTQAQEQIVVNMLKRALK